MKTVFFSLLVPGSVVGLFPFLLLSNGLEVLSLDPGWLGYPGIIPMAAGVALYLWSARDFVVLGRGTPAPIDPPKSLVICGPYRFVRNPMYLGGLLVLAGESVLLGSVTIAIYTLFVWLVFHLFVLLYEEPHLKKVFGGDYERYRESVPRWCPRITA